MMTRNTALLLFVLLSFLLVGDLSPLNAAQIDSEQINYGGACTTIGNNSADWDTIAECNSSTVWQRAPYMLGAAIDTTTCDSTLGGLMSYNKTSHAIQYCDGNGTWRTVNPGISNATNVTDGGVGYSCYTNAANQMYCVGAGFYLGIGVSSGIYSMPQLVAGSWSKVRSGYYHSCAITTPAGAGNLKCWGNNNSGELGNGNTTSQTSPVALSSSPTNFSSYTWSDVTIVGGVAGLNSCGLTNQDTEATCAVVASGTTAGAVYCWGDNHVGQLGNNNSSVTSTSVPVGPVVNSSGTTVLFKSLARATGTYGCHICGIGTDNNAYCWGYNGNGQIGNNSTTTSFAASQVSGSYGSGWSALATGGAHTCGITGGAMYCWGSGANGQLGNGTFTSPQKTPTAITNPTGVTQWQAVAAGSNHTCGIAGTGGQGAAYCWGTNQRGEMGLGSGNWAISYNTPQQVASPTGSGVNSTGWLDLYGSYFSTIGINAPSGSTSGSVYGWGGSSSNQFGDAYYGQLFAVQSP